MAGQKQASRLTIKGSCDASDDPHPNRNMKNAGIEGEGKQTDHLTAPLKTDKMPPGIPFIVGNEAAERFSYYGMNSILVIFMTQYMMNAQGQADRLSDVKAEEWYHTFVSFVYGLPLLGAFLADSVLGKYRVILWLSIVYCFGHFALALNDTRLGLFIGCSL